MILTEFPDLQWLKTQAEASFADRLALDGKPLPNQGWPNVILKVETDQTYRDNIRGPLSIFTNLCGESMVQTGNRKVKIREGFFFITNHDQYYTLEIEKQKAKTFNIHFGEYFADQVFKSLKSTPEKLLDEHCYTPSFERIEFSNTLFTKSHDVDHAIAQLSVVDNKLNKLLLEEKLYALMCILIRENKKIRVLRHQIPAIKNSTREELTKRLLEAKDYIYSHYDKDLSLEELGNISCLSKFHFLRLFKLAFHKTPHQFINEVRVNRAKEMLTRTNHGVNDIASQLGFDNASSFSRMFYNQVGVYPTQYR